MLTTMEHKKPWIIAPHIWKSESYFWTFVRGVLRKGWSKHPLKLEYIKTHRKRIINPVEANRERFPECWGLVCDICNKPTAQKDIEIDHIGDSCKFTGLHDVEKYVAHLFLIDYDSIRPLCKPCHKIVNQSQRSGVSFEQARIEKEMIAKLKDKNLLTWLSEHGYNGAAVSNAVKRKAAVAAILKGEIK